MRLQLGANLTGMFLVLLITLAIGAVAVVTIDDLTERLNLQLISVELDDYQSKVDDARQVLADNGLAGVREYVERAKSDLLHDFTRISSTMFGSLIIVNTAGKSVLHPEVPAGTGLEASCIQEFWSSKSGQGECSLGGKVRIGKFVTIPEWGWLLFVGVDAEKMVQTRNEFLLKAVVVFGVVSILGWLLLVRTASLVVKPLQELSGAAEAISTGNWSAVPQPMDRKDEIGDLSKSFILMAQRLRIAQDDLLLQADSLRQSNEQLEEEITERIRAEKDLRKATSAFSGILDSMPSLVIGVNTDCLVTHWNKSTEMATGVAAKSVVGSPLHFALPRLTGIVDTVLRSMLNQTPVRLDRVPYTRENELRQEDILIFPLVSDVAYGAVIRLDDVSERVRMEEMLIQSEKMPSLGGLAAGMAHEMNSPLAGISIQTFNIRNRIFGEVEKNEEVAKLCGISLQGVRSYVVQRDIPKMLDSIEDAGLRASKIMANMLQFSRSSEKRLVPHDLVELLERTLELADNDYDLKKYCSFEKICIVREFESELPCVACEGSELQQVFLNLIKNGAQAMAGKDYEDDAPTFVFRLASEGEVVRVEIEDNGPGMDESIRRRIFEPFFTTKPVGQGTGLGLSVSYFIVTDQHHGSIEVQSVPGQWTRFVIRLPVSPNCPA